MILQNLNRSNDQEAMDHRKEGGVEVKEEGIVEQR